MLEYLNLFNLVEICILLFMLILILIICLYKFYIVSNRVCIYVVSCIIYFMKLKNMYKYYFWILILLK